MEGPLIKRVDHHSSRSAWGQGCEEEKDSAATKMTGGGRHKKGDHRVGWGGEASYNQPLEEI